MMILSIIFSLKRITIDFVIARKDFRMKIKKHSKETKKKKKKQLSKFGFLLKIGKSSAPRLPRFQPSPPWIGWTLREIIGSCSDLLRS